MNRTYQQLFKQWAILAPDECLITNQDYKFKIRILPTVEKCESFDAWRLITTENFAWRLENGQSFTLPQFSLANCYQSHTANLNSQEKSDD
jgi:hypothetical protein